MRHTLAKNGQIDKGSLMSMIVPRLALAIFLTTCVPIAIADDLSSDGRTLGAYQLNGLTATSCRYANASPTASKLRPVGGSALAPGRQSERPYSLQIEKAAKSVGIDPLLIHAVVAVESGYNPRARSPKGAIGLMQIMPGTALRYGVSRSLREPEVNLRVGALYLSDLLKLFDNRLDLALAAYNAGELAVVRRNLRVPPYRETREYVPAVLGRYDELVRTVAPSSRRVVYLQGTRLRSSVREHTELQFEAALIDRTRLQSVVGDLR